MLRSRPTKMPLLSKLFSSNKRTRQSGMRFIVICKRLLRSDKMRRLLNLPRRPSSSDKSESLRRFLFKGLKVSTQLRLVVTG